MHLQKTIVSFFFILVYVATCISIHAQQPKAWTFAECVHYALDNNIDLKQLALQKESAEIELHTNRMSRLPDLNAALNQNWNFGRTQTESGLYENQSQANTSFSVGGSISLFTGFRIRNQIQKSKLDLEVSVQSIEKAKEDLCLNIASLFLQILFNKEILSVNNENLALSAEQVTKTNLLVEAGKIPFSQLYDIQAQVAKDEMNVVEAENNLKLSLLTLAQVLDVTDVSFFDIEEPDFDGIEKNNPPDFLPPDFIYDNAVALKPQIAGRKLAMESSVKSLKIAEAGYYPTITLDVGYNTGYYHLYDNRTNRSFTEQLKNNAGEYIGLTMSIPVFNRFQVKNQVRTARLNIENQRLELDKTKKELYKEIQTSYYNAVAAQEKLKVAEHSVKATRESFTYAQEKYDAGKSTVFEYNEAKTRLFQSVSEQIQAKYEYIFRCKILDFYNGTEIDL